MASTSIRAHFDGKVVVPDEPMDLAAGTPVTVHVRLTPNLSAEEMKKRQEAYDAFMAIVRENPGPHLSDEQLRRENMYED